MSNPFNRLPLQDQILIIKRLAILIKAGVPILAALEMLKSQASSRVASQMLTSVIADVENGQFLSTSLSRHRNIFGKLAISVVQIGEVSGTLHENLNYLSNELAKKQALRRKVFGSLVYPIFIVVATLGITGLLTVYIFPKILPIFRSLNFELPWTTRTLIYVSDLLLHEGVYLVLGLVGLVATVVALLRVQAVRYWVDRLILHVPIFGHVAQSYLMANFCRTLGLLLQSNVRIVEATTIAADTIGNLAYQEALQAMAGKVTKGEKISTHMSEHQKLFPPMLNQMVMVGETSGSLSETFLYLAEIYENEVEDRTKNLSTLLEPALMGFMGLIVGFVAISIITPIYAVTQNLHP